MRDMGSFPGPGVLLMGALLLVLLTAVACAPDSQPS